MTARPPSFAIYNAVTGERLEDFTPDRVRRAAPWKAERFNLLAWNDGWQDGYRKRLMLHCVTPLEERAYLDGYDAGSRQRQLDEYEAGRTREDKPTL